MQILAFGPVSFPYIPFGLQIARVAFAPSKQKHYMTQGLDLLLIIFFQKY